ncbi:MAG: glycosyltransferase, partial [Isosphaeraceae bacterium]|nr:glycosyltransferase [Isosphaeraceae bacterium]
MARIIIILSDPPLPFGDAAARWYYVLLRGLVERGHCVSALAVCSDPRQGGQVAELFPTSSYDLRLYASPARSGLRAKVETMRRPYSYLFGPDLRRDLAAELARGFDVLHLEQLWTGWLGLPHTERAVLHIHYLLGIDLAEAPARSWMERARWTAALRAERWLLRHYPTITTLTPRLTDRVRRINPRGAVHTVPLGLDLSLYPFEPTAPAPRPPGGGRGGGVGGG